VCDWISVKDRMPPSDERVLIYAWDWPKTQTEQIGIAVYWQDDEEWWAGGYIYDVTHWAPLLDPPEDSNE